MVRQALVILSAPLLTLGAQRCRDCGPEDTLPRSHVIPAVGLHAGAPQKASVSLGMVFAEEWQQEGHDHSRNIALLVEPGLDAGRTSIAYVRHGYGNFGSGFGFAASLLRTWKEPVGARPNVTYAGGDLILWPILFIGPRVGVFHSIAGNRTDRRWMLSLDFGIGL